MKRTSVILALSLLAACGCRHMNNTGAGALGGGIIGTGAGAVIGHAAGDTGAGALIGAGVGTLLGAAHGSAVDDAERRGETRAVQQIQHQQAVEEAQRARLSVGDVLHMSQQGVDEQIIINQIRQSGSVFDLRAEDIVMLKRHHVSPNVIIEMQTRRPPVVYQRPPVVERRVIVHEYDRGPHLNFGLHSYRSYPRHRHHHHRRCW